MPTVLSLIPSLSMSTVYSGALAAESCSNLNASSCYSAPLSTAAASTSDLLSSSDNVFNPVNRLPPQRSERSAAAHLCVSASSSVQAQRCEQPVQQSISTTEQRAAALPSLKRKQVASASSQALNRSAAGSNGREPIQPATTVVIAHKRVRQKKQHGIDEGY